MGRPEAAYWVVAPGHGEIRPAAPETPGPGEVRVRTRWSAISRGTETMVFEGRVPARERDTMRAPFQEGTFPGPVKYGYLSVGSVDAGPDELLGRTVFCLHPHQTAYVVPATAVVPVPDDIPARRAVLAGTVETAVNALWEATPLIGDRVAIVGAGMVGCCVARLVAGIPGVRATLVDRNPARRPVAEALGIPFALPEEAPVDCDLVFHCSATSAGLQRSLELLRPEGSVIELSWYGDRPVELRLGEAFHSSRLRIRASQVGAVPAARAGSRTCRDRLELALDLLRDPAFDSLVTGCSPFADLPQTMAALAAGTLDDVCRVIDYDAAGVEV